MFRQLPASWGILRATLIACKILLDVVENVDAVAEDGGKETRHSIQIKPNNHQLNDSQTYKVLLLENVKCTKTKTWQDNCSVKKRITN